MTSWVEVSPESDFSLQNLPYGIFSAPTTSQHSPSCRVGVAIGAFVLDLQCLHERGVLNALPFDTSIFGHSTLNAFMCLTSTEWRATRARLIDLLTTDGDPILREDVELQTTALHPQSSVRMHLPASIGDYTDFYSSREHATNVGIMLRGKDNALQANWLHLPVGYHGRSSSVVLSGTDIVRPFGQVQVSKDDPKQGSTFAPTKSLDFEVEMGVFVGGNLNALGSRIDIGTAHENLFGVVLLNDWSARDVQAWEYVPLGPFTAKSFATSISPWVVTMDALAPFRCASSAGK
jgi:fumarylacetoacetase